MAEPETGADLDARLALAATEPARPEPLADRRIHAGDVADALVDAGIVLGGLLVVAGVALWSVAAALVVAGAMLIVGCWLIARASLTVPVNRPERR